MADIPFIKKNRNMISTGPFKGSIVGGGVVEVYTIYYETNQIEYNRVYNKPYTVEGITKTGGEWGLADKDTISGKYYIRLMSIDKNTGSSLYSPTAGEIGNGNYDLSRSIANDKGLISQILGTSPKNASTVDPNSNPPATTGNSPTTTFNTTEFPFITQIEREKYAKLTYPMDMKKGQDVISFTALRYKPKAIEVGDNAFGFMRRSYDVNELSQFGTAFLAIQSPITDQNSVGWETDTLDPIQLKAAQMSLNIMKSPGTENITNELVSKFNEARQKLKQYSEEVRTSLAGQAIGVNNLNARLNGKILNSNLELLFQGTQLRPFNFTFKLSPRNKDEADEVKKIIKFFKSNMAPLLSPDRIFLQSPNIFRIRYLTKDKETHLSLNLIKECALLNCSVDYTPLGSYMTYNDERHTMVCYVISLQFQELEPIYSHDYKHYANITGEVIEDTSKYPNDIGY